MTGPEPKEMNCPRCHLPMQFTAVQEVPGPDKAGHVMHIYECTYCSKIAAVEAADTRTGHAA